MIVYEGEIKSIDMLHVAAAGLLSQLIGRDLDDDEFWELLRILKAAGRLARTLPDEDFEENNVDGGWIKEE